MTDRRIVEGKTKVIVSDKLLPGEADIVSKNCITAGDGAKKDSFPDKGLCAATTTSNVFRLINACGIQTAFIAHQEGSVVFRAKLCTMLPYEVVIRRLALGSYLKRNPTVSRRTPFFGPPVEFYLKTSGQVFRGIQVPKDDPFILARSEYGIVTHSADLPSETPSIPLVFIPASILFKNAQGVTIPHPFEEMKSLALRVFFHLENAWKKENCTLADLKIEFGYTREGQLVVADVIDNDSWRLLDENGDHLDKQRYRDGASIEEVAALYRTVMKLTEQF